MKSTETRTRKYSRIFSGIYSGIHSFSGICPRKHERKMLNTTTKTGLDTVKTTLKNVFHKKG